MTDALSQEQINLLLDLKSNSDNPNNIYNENKVRIYNFKRPEKFSKDQFEHIRMIHETLSRKVSKDLSNKINSTVSVQLGSVDSLNYEEFIRSLPNPTTLGLFNLGISPGCAVINIDPNVTTAIIDRLFGGKGEIVKIYRELSDIEIFGMEVIVKNILNSFRDSWLESIELRPRLVKIESNPQFVNILSPDEMVILITMNIKVLEEEGMFYLCLPYSTIYPILNKISGSFLIKPNIDNNRSDRYHLPGNLHIDIYNSFSAGILTIREIIELKKGDRLSISENSLRSVFQTSNGLPEPKSGSLNYSQDENMKSNPIQEHQIKLDTISDNLEKMMDLCFPLEIRFYDQSISFTDYSSRNYVSKSSLENFKNKKGILYFGNLKVGDAYCNEFNSLKIIYSDLEGYSEVSRLNALIDARFSLRLSVFKGKFDIEEYTKIQSGNVLKSNIFCSEDLLLTLSDIPFARSKVVLTGSNFNNFGAKIRRMIDLKSTITEIHLAKSGHESRPTISYEVVFAETEMSFKEILKIGEGNVIEFNKQIQDFSYLSCSTGAIFPVDVRTSGEYLDALILGAYASESYHESTEQTIQEEVGNSKSIDLETIPISEPFAVIQGLNPITIINLIKEENPQIIALFLSNIKTDLAGSLLSQLPPKIQSDVVKRIASMDRISKDILIGLERVLYRKLSIGSSYSYTTSVGIDNVIEILKSSGKETKNLIISLLQKENSNLFRELKKLSFNLEDIVFYDDRAIQKILRKVDSGILAIAMKRSSTEVQNKIFSNMSKRASRLLREDMDCMGPIRLKDVEDAFKSLEDVIRLLEYHGEIVVARG